MKKNIIFLCLIAVSAMSQLFAQATSACPGWHNPTSFVTGNNQYIYSGSVIENLNSNTGTGGMANHVGVDAEFYVGQAVTTGASLATVVANSGCYSLALTDGNYRFRIKTSASGNAGADPNTGNALRFVPSANGNNGLPYTSSIRVGTECTYGSEVLYYQMRVKPENSLLTVWYAPVIENPGHTYDINPGFIIRVKHKVGDQWIQDNTNLDYVISGTPHSSTYPQGMENGVNGWHLVGSVWYKEWTKVMISLNEYLQQDIRVEIYMSACKYNAHYAYAYVAGDSQPMQVSSSGCPAGRSIVVDTLRGPQDMISYSWYKSTNGVDITGNVFNLEFLDSTANGNTIRTTLHTADGDQIISWTRVTQPSPNREYLVQANDFVVGGQTLGVQSFMCKMMSYMDPAKPFPSFVYQSVENNKPELSIGSFPTCDGKVRLVNTSLSHNKNLDSALTRWQIYDNAQCMGSPLQTLSYDHAVFQAPREGNYYAKLWCCTEGDSACNTEQVFPIHALENPVARIGVNPNDEPCLGDQITLIDSTYLGNDGSRQFSNWSRTWLIDSLEIQGSAADPQQNYNYSFVEQDTVTLITRNGLNYPNPNNMSELIWCADTAQRVIKVFTSPELTVTGDSIVCKGSTTNARITADAENCSFQWYYHYKQPGETSFATGDVLQVEPAFDTTTYYVKVTSAKGCIAWDSVRAFLIRPVIHMLPADGRICPGDSVTLYGTDAHHFSWTSNPYDFSLDVQGDKDTIVVSPTETTTYVMTGHGSNDCSANPLEKIVTIIPFPELAVQLSPDFVDSEDPTITFSDVSRYSVSSDWDFGDGNIGTGATITHTFSDLATDSITINLRSGNSLHCYSDTAFKVPVRLFSVWIPTAFTPNLSTNNTFAPITANELEYYTIFIYNRQGLLVFSSTDVNIAWDGTHKGVVCPQGAYTYICRYRRPGTSDVVVRTGTVTLIR